MAIDLQTMLAHAVFADIADELPQLETLGSTMSLESAAPRIVALSLELNVPVEVIEPTFMQVVRRKSAAAVLEVVGRRAAGFLARLHLSLRRHSTTLGEITARAGRDDVFPGGPPTP